MAEQLSCSCGDTSGIQSGKKRILFPCAGVANVGQLTNLAALQLTAEGYGAAACVALLAIGAEGLKESIAEADEVVVLDGCPVQCATKIALMQGVRPAQQIVVTDLGFKKAYTKDFSDADIEAIVSDVWEGAGRRKEPDGGNKPTAKGENYGCGCGGRC
jgi:uncharacterized metal-binding protein